MNYFGHAAVAHLRRRDPAFVLGAMLPDLVPMAGVAVPKVLADRRLSEGLSFHIATDSVFHETPSFVHWNRQALLDLRALGVSRGPARACAHMGVEMLIDAELSKNGDFYSSYERALTIGVEDAELLSPMGRADLRKARGLFAHLLERGRSVFEPSFERFALRLGRTLAHRPRLAPSRTELDLIANYLSAYKTPLRDLGQLMGELSPFCFAGEPTSPYQTNPASGQDAP